MKSTEKDLLRSAFLDGIKVALNLVESEILFYEWRREQPDGGEAIQEEFILDKLRSKLYKIIDEVEP